MLDGTIYNRLKINVLKWRNAIDNVGATTFVFPVLRALALAIPIVRSVVLSVLRLNDDSHKATSIMPQK